MYCPKCGTENPNDGSFCRGCGANLVNVLAFVEGTITTEGNSVADEKNAHLYSSGVRNVILAMGFVVASIFIKSMPGDTYFWLLSLFPGICLLASGITRILKFEELKKLREEKISNARLFPQSQPIQSLPPSQADYIKPRSKYKTEELVERPPSVTEETTRHLDSGKL
jgi:hypothetical protein